METLTVVVVISTVMVVRAINSLADAVRSHSFVVQSPSQSPSQMGAPDVAREIRVVAQCIDALRQEQRAYHNAASIEAES